MTYKKAVIWTEGSLIMGRVAPEQESYPYMETVKKALEKQIPKKPKCKTYPTGGFEILCECGKQLYRVDKYNCEWGHKMAYCELCGQAIDWNEQ